GPQGHGTVFKLGTNGQECTVLRGFSGGKDNGFGRDANSEGAWLKSGVARSGDTLFGAATHGGSAGDGTVFKMDTGGGGFTVLHHFKAREKTPTGAMNFDGGEPGTPVVAGKVLYGTTSDFTDKFMGSVFRLGTDGTGFTTLHQFAGNDGAGVGKELFLSGDTLYGTANFGGGG